MDSDNRETSRVSGTSPQDGYDYKALREKMRKSWGLASEEEPEKKKAAAEIPVSDKTASFPADKSRKAYHAGAVQKMTNEYLKIESPAAPADKREQRKAAAGPGKTKFTARDVRQWVIYDAVLGRPRSLKPWRSRF